MPQEQRLTQILFTEQQVSVEVLFLFKALQKAEP